MIYYEHHKFYAGGTLFRKFLKFANSFFRKLEKIIGNLNNFNNFFNNFLRTTLQISILVLQNLYCVKNRTLTITYNIQLYINYRTYTRRPDKATNTFRTVKCLVFKKFNSSFSVFVEKYLKFLKRSKKIGAYSN